MKIRTVIADDHAIVLEGLEQILKLEEDIELVARCIDGEQALKTVRSFRPDVLVLDMRMPVMDGLAVLREIKREGLPTKVVLLTAGLDDDEMIRAVRFGVSGVILKVMASRLLIQCIRTVAAGGRWIEKDSEARPVQRTTMDPHGTGLSPREIEVVRMVSRGMRNRQIAQELFISEATVKVHLHNVYEKLSLKSRVELGLFAREKGLL